MVNATVLFPDSIYRLAVKRGGIVKTSEVYRIGIDSHRVSRLITQGILSKPGRGLLVIKEAALQSLNDVGEPQYLRLRAAYSPVLAAGPSAAAAGQAAIVLMGAQGLPKTIIPEFTTKSGGPTALDHIYHNRREPFTQARQINGVNFVLPEVALAQAVTGLPRNNAIALMDSMLNNNLLDPTGLARAENLTARRVNAKNVRPWWRLVDQRSQSPAETFARLTCLDLGCPADALQLEVFDAFGSQVARVDMGWRLPDGRWLLGEIDGFDFHSTARQLQADRSRQNQLMSSNTILRRWNGADALSGRLASDVHRILQDARWRPGQVPKPEAARMWLAAR